MALAMGRKMARETLDLERDLGMVLAMVPEMDLVLVPEMEMPQAQGLDTVRASAKALGRASVKDTAKVVVTVQGLDQAQVQEMVLVLVLVLVLEMVLDEGHTAMAMDQCALKLDLALGQDSGKEPEKHSLEYLHQSDNT